MFMGDGFEGFQIMDFLIIALIAFPGLVTSGLDKAVKVDLDTIQIDVQSGDDGGWGQQKDTWGGGSPETEGEPAVDSKRPGDSETPADTGGEASTGFGNTQRGW